MTCAGRLRFAKFAAYGLCAAALASAGIAPRMAMAADDSGDSGLSGGHRFRVGVGASTTPEHLGGLFQETVTANDTGGEDIGLGIPGVHFEAAKADYTFFRPARQEALVSVYAVRSFYDAYAFKNKSLVTIGQSQTEYAVAPEYRLRFFGHGIGYAGVGIGAANRGLVFTGTSAVVTGAVGADLGPFYVEARSLYFRREDAAFTSVFGGVRF